MEMGSVLLHLGFLIMVLQQRACTAEKCVHTFHAQVHAQAGGNVSMNCSFSIDDPRKAPTVVWSYPRQTSDVILYMSRNGSENRTFYQPPFEGRTWVNATGLAHGDATLHLAGVTAADQGNFSCFVGLSFDCMSVEVQLWVSEHNQQASLNSDYGLVATCFSGLLLSLAAAVILCV